MSDSSEPDRAPSLSTNALELDAYEMANLREVLLFAASLGGDTGDWFQQVLSRLPVESPVKPNRTAQELKRELALRAGWQLLFPSA